MDEDSGLEVISLGECVRLLESSEIGRIAVATDDGPRIYPVNYHWDGEAIVFRTTPGSKIASNATWRRRTIGTWRSSSPSSRTSTVRASSKL